MRGAFATAWRGVTRQAAQPQALLAGTDPVVAQILANARAVHAGATSAQNIAGQIWAQGMASATVENAGAWTPDLQEQLPVIGRSLLDTGNAVYLLERGELVPVASWEISRDLRAYRLYVSRNRPASSGASTSRPRRCCTSGRASGRRIPGADSRR